MRTILTTSWWVSKNKADLAWIEPQVVGGRVDLKVVSGQRTGNPPVAPKVGRGASFTYLGCGSLIGETSLISQGLRGELGLRMTCVVSERDGRRSYRAPDPDDTEAADSVVVPDDVPDLALPNIPRWFSGPRFGFTTQADLYTSRQLITHTIVADLIGALPRRIVNDGGDQQWADAVTTILALSLGKMIQVASTLAIWRHEPTPKAEAALSSHSLPMMWDFPEVFPFGGSVGDWMGQVKTACRAFALLPGGGLPSARVVNLDCSSGPGLRGRASAKKPS